MRHSAWLMVSQKDFNLLLCPGMETLRLCFSIGLIFATGLSSRHSNSVASWKSAFNRRRSFFAAKWSVGFLHEDGFDMSPANAQG